MRPSSLLEDFGHLLPWNLARRRCFVSMIFGVFLSGSVQQHKMAQGFTFGKQNNAKNESICARIRSFFRDFAFDYDDFARSIVKMTGLRDPYVLALDRTNWKFGRLDINLLVLAVVVNKTFAVPVFWVALPKAGNSNSAERISIIQRFIDVFGIGSIHEITADREFIGKVWVDFLIEKQISFCIRIKENRLVEWGDQTKAIRSFFNHLNGSGSRFAEFDLDGHRLYFEGARTPTGDLIIVMSNKKGARKLLKKYKNRWTIELLFRNLKSSGFNLEETHLVHLDRIEKMFAVVSMALLVAFLVGTRRESEDPTPYKQTVKAPLFSTFRRGFDWLRRLFSQGMNEVIQEFSKTLKKIIR